MHKHSGKVYEFEIHKIYVITTRYFGGNIRAEGNVTLFYSTTSGQQLRVSSFSWKYRPALDNILSQGGSIPAGSKIPGYYIVSLRTARYTRTPNSLLLCLLIVDDFITHDDIRNAMKFPRNFLKKFKFRIKKMFSMCGVNFTED